VGRRAAPRSFPRIAKADRDATRGVLDQIYRFLKGIRVVSCTK
jgi:hypothetical protein